RPKPCVRPNHVKIIHGREKPECPARDGADHVHIHLVVIADKLPTAPKQEVLTVRRLQNKCDTVFFCNRIRDALPPEFIHLVTDIHYISHHYLVCPIILTIMYYFR